MEATAALALSTDPQWTEATYFDGRTAQARKVSIGRAGGELLVVEQDPAESSTPLTLLRVSLDRLEVSDPMPTLPRLVHAGGATLEVPDSFALDLLLGARRPGLVQRLQASWHASLACLAVLLGLAAWGYLDGIPAAARSLAFALPGFIEQRIGEQALLTLDDSTFQPSGLDAQTRDRLDDSFRQMAARAAPGLVYQLEFRKVAGIGSVNAFALPGGTIVLLDDLVYVAQNDARVLSVLGHELGHVAHKHAMRSVLQALGTSMLAMSLWGDFSGVVANVPAVIGILHHSRAFELEADDYTVAFLRANGMTTRPYIEFFGMIRARGREKANEVPEFASTHPSDRDRLRRLRRHAE